MNACSVQDKLMSRIVVVENCWEWAGAVDRKGYGRVWNNGKQRFAHRVSWEAFRGEIPAGLTIDHLCRNHRCINPEHLQPVSGEENTLRGNSPHAQNARKTACKHGHPLDAVYVPLSGKKAGKNIRHCLTCKRGWDRKYNKQRGAYVARKNAEGAK